MKRRQILSAAAAVAMTLGAQGTTAQDLTVAYFLEWPMPFEYAKVNEMYEEALGVNITWRSFGTGTEMSAAMASGDVQIAVSQGVPPFVVAASGGQDLQVLDIAVSYSENDNCVVAANHEIDKTNAHELRGKKVAVPLGTAAHYGFLRQMDHFNVPLSSLSIVNMAPPEGSAALAQGAVDMACGWGGSLRRMLEHGNVLLTGAEKEELGILVFDVTSAPAGFVAENSELVARFLKVTADMNALWNKYQGWAQAEMLPVVARDAGMDVVGTASTMSTFTFPSVRDQLSGKWLGGGVQEFMKGVADVFVDAGDIDSALDTYENAVNPGPLRAASRM